MAHVADATWSVPRASGATFDAGTSGTGSVSVQNSSTTDNILQVGGTSGNASIATAIIPFVLPTLAPGETFATASFSIGQTTASNAQQVDLFGLSRRAAPAALASDYYRGTTGGDTTDATLIQAAFVGTADTFLANTLTSTSAAGETALLAFLNSQYAAGAGAGETVFLRLNVTDTFTTTNTRLNPAAAEHATASFRPTITYTVIPEPSSAALLGLGALALLRRRR